VHPQRFRFNNGSFRGNWSAALTADFKDEDVQFLYEEPLALEAGSDGTTFRWWQRWYAARRHLAAYDLLLIVDPDTAVFPTCTGVDLLTALGLPADMTQWPGVITRDPRTNEDLNGGVFALTGSPWGHLYLELLLARSRWPVDFAGGGGWCNSRQAAEYETLLEVIALGRMYSTGLPLDYTSECMLHALPQVTRNRDSENVAGCIWPVYLACWKKVVARLIGPPGNRSSWHAKLLDPVFSDINYRPWSNEARYTSSALRTGELHPITNSAFLWHYVGIPDKATSMLRDFGLRSLADTFDCQQLHRTFDSGGLPGCQLAGSSQACPFPDSKLMPHVYGC